LFFSQKIFADNDFLLVVSLCIKIKIKCFHYEIKDFDEIDIINHVLNFNLVRKKNFRVHFSDIEHLKC